MDQYIACHDCDLLHTARSLPVGRIALCSRCGAVLYRHKRNPLDRTLALALTGLILFILANSFPFLAIKQAGLSQQTTLISGIIELYHEKLYLVSLLVLLTTLVVPFLELCTLLYIFLPLRLGVQPKYLAVSWRCLSKLRSWSLMEVFMLAILVAMVKLAGMATIVPGVSVFAFAALIFILAAACTAIDPTLIWAALEESWRR
ncbi:MAG: paraquat-inducible protein A [Desulfuromonadaceae bacterium]